MTVIALILLGLGSLWRFLKAFFCNYTVSEIEAKVLLNGGDHGNSIFINECKKKFESFTIEIVNEPSIGTQKYYDEEKRNDNVEVSNGSDKQESLGVENDELKNRR